jgi:NDP-sugar pyrophosphorylase family protein
VTGFVLAAGLGTRLRPLTEHMPKALVPVCGVALIEHSLRLLMRNGISRLGANAHHRAEEVASFCAALPFEVALLHETGAIRGTGGALHFARGFLAGDDAFCVVNADIVAGVDLDSCAKRFGSDSCACALLAAPARGAGTIAFDSHTGAYTGTVGDRGGEGAGARADFIGMAFYRRSFLDVLRPDDFSIVPVWTRAAGCGRAVAVYLLDGCSWRDAGTPQVLAQAHFDALDGTWAPVLTAEGMVIDREAKTAYPAAMPRHVSASLGPYTWTGSAAIDPTARIARSVVLAGASVPAHAAVTGKIVTQWGDIDCGTGM